MTHAEQEIIGLLGEALCHAERLTTMLQTLRADFERQVVMNGDREASERLLSTVVSALMRGQVIALDQIVNLDTLLRAYVRASASIDHDNPTLMLPVLPPEAMMYEP
jgi:hypothetical protein